MCVHVCACACVIQSIYCTPHGGLNKFGCLFMFDLWSYCYDNLLSIIYSTCLSQPLHYVVVAVERGGGGGGGGGGPSGGSGSEGEKEVGCCCSC